MKKQSLYTPGIWLAVLAVGWLIVNYLILADFQQMMARKVAIEVIEERAPYLYLGLFYLMLFHVFALVSLVVQVRSFNGGHAFRYLLIVLGSISLIFFLADAALLSDIGKEYQLWEVRGEFIALYAVDGLHGLFLIGMLFNLIHARHLSRLPEKTAGHARDDAVFVSTHVVGLVCGLVGIASLLMEFLVRRPDEFRHLILLWNIAFILMPYAIMVLVWVVVRLLSRPLPWYDEKQSADISRSALITLLVGIPFLKAGYVGSFFGDAARLLILWVPLTLFLVLGLFSGLTLLYFREV